MSPREYPATARDGAVALSCRYCGFSIRPRAWFLTMDHCPRCLATRHVAETLHASSTDQVDEHQPSRPRPPPANLPRVSRPL